MKARLKLTRLILAGCFVPSAFCLRAEAQGPAFTYQGRLNDGATPATGIYDLRFTIYDSTNLPGMVIVGPLTNSATGVSNGLFTVALDFGAEAFTGPDRWLEIAVRTNGTANFFTLAPRQQLTPAPYALTAGNLAAVVAFNFINAPSCVVGGGSNNVIQVDASGSTIGGGLNNTVGAQSDQTTIAGGNFNSIGEECTYATVGGGAANFIGDACASATIAGGLGNSIDYSDYATISGGHLNSVAQDCGSSVISGGSQNHLLQASDGSVIGGGFANTIIGGESVLGGGEANSLQSNESFLGGGLNNWSIESSDSFLGGGDHNLIAFSFNSFLGGGQANSVATNANFGVLAGGQNNSVVGSFGAIPGGDQNSATNNAFAAGHRAKSVHTGAFVWADSQDADFASTANNQFLIRAAGGVGIGTNAPTTLLQVGSATCNGTTWANASDRNAKENFQPVSGLDVLRAVAALPLSRWNYKGDKTNEHIGPMAQDFHAAFGLNGNDDRHIATVDADGVALAAIQGLNRKVVEQGAELKRKETEIAELKRRLEALERRVAIDLNPPD